jgi:hypothetical protein
MQRGAGAGKTRRPNVSGRRRQPPAQSTGRHQGQRSFCCPPWLAPALFYARAFALNLTCADSTQSQKPAPAYCLLVLLNPHHVGSGGQAYAWGHPCEHEAVTDEGVSSWTCRCRRRSFHSGPGGQNVGVPDWSRPGAVNCSPRPAAPGPVPGAPHTALNRPDILTFDRFKPTLNA